MEELTEGYCLDVFEKLPWPDQLIISLAACDDRGVKYEPSAIYPDDVMEFLNAVSFFLGYKISPFIIYPPPGGCRPFWGGGYPIRHKCTQENPAVHSPRWY